MKYFYDLFNGEIGEVVEGSDWDEENECIVIDGVKYDEMWECEEDIDKFLDKNGVDGLKMFRSGGYRGDGCYSGFMVVNGKKYSLDVMNDYKVYELK